ncbi:hypothetical protein Nmel_005228, partial [Mimus melanotis]
MDTVTVTKEGKLCSSLYLAGQKEEYFGSFGFVQTGAGPAWNLMK